MRCPRCSHVDDRVVDTRPSRDGNSIRRRRECLACGFRFTTYEAVEVALPNVVKSDGRREPYSRTKLTKALRTACQKRPVATSQIDAMLDRVEVALVGLGEREVPARTIGDIVISHLRELDGVAWLRFASVYYSFDDLQQFLAAVEAASARPDEP